MTTPNQAPARRHPKTVRMEDGDFTIRYTVIGEMPEVRLYQGTGEWSALYVEGRLAAYGDHSTVMERLVGALGIPVVYGENADDAFDLPDGLLVAETIVDIDARTRARKAREAEAAALEEQAAALLGRARDLLRAEAP